MGYSLSVRLRRRTAPAVRKFLLSQVRSFPEILGELDRYAYASTFGDDFSYGKKGPTRIGLDYSSGVPHFEREYVYALIRWVAERFSYRGKLAKPSYYYDSQRIPVEPEGGPPLGGDAKFWATIEGVSEQDIEKKYLAPIRNEIERLERGWKAFSVKIRRRRNIGEKKEVSPNDDQRPVRPNRRPRR